MPASIQYHGVYTDGSGTIPLKIENDFETLSCEIEGVKFRGSEFSRLFIDEIKHYSIGQLARFTLKKISFYDSDEVGYVLNNCAFSATVPQTLIDKEGYMSYSVNIVIACNVGKQQQIPESHDEFEEYRLTLTVEGQTVQVRNSHIEYAFLDLLEQTGYRYRFRNCFGCMYGDYSVYGSAAWGAMLCYVNQKEAYKRVVDKDEYMELDTSICRVVQEIYCCDSFEARVKGVGYRG